MRRHTAFRTGNPALTAKTFKNASDDASGKMTLEGSVNKAGLSLLILLLTSFYTFITQNTNPPNDHCQRKKLFKRKGFFENQTSHQ